ncbi:MAG: hypothetical protein ABW092_01065 [Candidatus Thiodiazotropha sp.]
MQDEKALSQMSEDRFQRLLPVVQGLYQETASLSESESELQLWYNRGYADGMVEAMRSSGFTAQLDAAGVVADRPLLSGHEFMPWGKAYRHGFEMGEKETSEVL